MLCILHTSPPYFAVKYANLQDPPISYEIHIDMSETAASRHENDDKVWDSPTANAVGEP